MFNEKLVLFAISLIIFKMVVQDPNWGVVILILEKCKIYHIVCKRMKIVKLPAKILQFV